jgi:hypothetical protein
MSTQITTKPFLTTPLELSSELGYDLSAEDFVACWRFLASKSRHHLPLNVSRTLSSVVFWLHAGISVALIVLALACRFPHSRDVMAITVMVAVLNVVLGGVLADVHPGLYLDGFLAKPCRWACMRGLRYQAREEAKKGRTALLDILSHYRFAMNRGGFIHEAEYQQRFGGSPATLWRKQDEIAWWSVEVVGNTEQHVFFVLRDSIPVIVPRSCFADDSSFRLFAVLSRRAWRIYPSFR